MHESVFCLLSSDEFQFFWDKMWSLLSGVDSCGCHFNTSHLLRFLRISRARARVFVSLFIRIVVCNLIVAISLHDLLRARIRRSSSNAIKKLWMFRRMIWHWAIICQCYCLTWFELNGIFMLPSTFFFFFAPLHRQTAAPGTSVYAHIHIFMRLGSARSRARAMLTFGQFNNFSKSAHGQVSRRMFEESFIDVFGLD